MKGLIIMGPRIDVTQYPDALKAMYGLESASHGRGRGGCARVSLIR